jgi:tRNA 5-methylaminomethyl-2-thiouridine biosynthesis bifunctional protein
MLSTDASDKLRIPLCAKGHILPSCEGIHHLGATYQSDSGQGDCYDSDDKENVMNLNALPTDLDWSKKMVGHWSGVRAATPDYMPLVGPVAQVDLFQQRFLDFSKNPKRWIPFPGSYHDGLYICTGFGSRGLTSIPLATDFLAEMISKEPASLPRSMMQSLSPARFLRREIICSLKGERKQVIET